MVRVFDVLCSMES